MIWTAIENIYPFIFPNYLGASQYMLLPLIQIADVTGILGLSFLVVWCNAMVFTLLETHMMQQKFPILKLAVFASVIGMIIVYGTIRIQQTDAAVAAAPVIKVAMIQAGEGGVDKHKDPWQFVQLHQDLTRQAISAVSSADADLVIWPESVLTQPLSRSMEKLPETLFDKMGKPVLFGAYTAERKDGKIKSYVSAVLVDEELRVQGRYDKHILVPFGEYIPLGDLFPKLYHHLPYTTGSGPGKILPLWSLKITGFR